MTRKQLWTAFIATTAIVLALGFYALLEPGRMESAAASQRDQAVEGGTTIYAESCVICHGAAGEGIGANLPLDSEGLRGMDYSSLYKVVERGRYGTSMAPWGVSEGGILNPAEIDQLVAVMLYADWVVVAYVVEEMGLTPPAVIAAEIPSETLELIRELPNGKELARALPVYSANCLACHGAAGEGNNLGPALNSDELRARLDIADITRLIANGVPRTLMAGWEGALTAETINDLTILIRKWETLEDANIELPEAPVPEIPMTAEAIALGKRLYGVACASCHGSNGQGWRMAPALNAKGYLSATNDLALQQIITMGVPGTSMPSWGDRLSGVEIDALVAFIRSWELTAPEVAEPARGGGSPAGVPEGAPDGAPGPPWLRDEDSSGGSD